MTAEGSKPLRCHVWTVSLSLPDAQIFSLIYCDSKGWTLHKTDKNSAW